MHPDPWRHDEPPGVLTDVPTDAPLPVVHRRGQRVLLRLPGGERGYVDRRVVRFACDGAG